MTARAYHKKSPFFVIAKKLLQKTCNNPRSLPGSPLPRPHRLRYPQFLHQGR